MTDIPPPNELYIELRDQLVDDDVDTIKGYLRNNPLSPRELEMCKTFTDICMKLQEFSAPGDASSLNSFWRICYQPGYENKEAATETAAKMGKKDINQNYMYLEIDGQLDELDMKRIRVCLRNKPLSPAVLAECENFSDIAFRLEKLKMIVPEDHDFKFLSNMFEKLNLPLLKAIVEDFVALNKYEDICLDILRKSVDDERQNQVKRVHSEIMTKIAELERQYGHSPILRLRIALGELDLCTEYSKAFSRRLESIRDIHEVEWNATFNWNEPKRVSDRQVIEWVEVAERQKKEYRDLAEEQIKDIERFADQIHRAMQEKECAAHGSSNGNVSGGQDSGNHCVPPDSQPNC